MADVDLELGGWGGGGVMLALLTFLPSVIFFLFLTKNRRVPCPFPRSATECTVNNTQAKVREIKLSIHYYLENIAT